MKRAIGRAIAGTAGDERSAGRLCDLSSGRRRLRQLLLTAVIAASMLALGAVNASAVIVKLGKRQADQLPAAARRRPTGHAIAGGLVEPDLPRRPGDDLQHELRLLLGAERLTGLPGGIPVGRQPVPRRPRARQRRATERRLGRHAVHDGSGEAVAYNSHFAGAIVDTDPYPKNGCKKAAICLTDAQLQSELNTYITAHGLPRDLAHEYFLLTPPGVEDCFEASGSECSAGTSVPTYCAYHGSFASEGGVIVYANDPFVTGVEGCDDGEHPNNEPSDGALEGGLSHEHNESTTDPELNAWFGPEGDENGDKCRTFVASSEFGTPLGTAPDGSRYNQLVNGREYWYQQEWSNEGSTCKQRQAVGTPQVTKLGRKLVRRRVARR